MDTGNRKNIELARRILAAETVKIEEILGEETGPTAAAGVEEGYAAALFKLAMRLKKEGEFGYAHKILNWARKISVTDPALRFRLRQQQALCIYKDPLLPLGQRLDWALEVLGQEEDLRSTQNPETLGLAGAIYKRKWEADGQKQNLEQSLAYYLRGYEAGPENDNGYTAINAAYILDLLSSLEPPDAMKTDAVPAASDTRRETARKIRERLIEVLPGMLAQEGNKHLRKDWWFLATIAEAYFGLKQYDRALQWLEKAKELNPEPWQYESTATQLGNLAYLHEEEESRAVPSSTEAAAEERAAGDAWSVLREFLGGNETGLRNARVGKVGLALAGSGFRASLFHLGVLAKLAELDVLRNVEVLSCVSGGSVIGAHYYLEVRRLLQTKPDHKIEREDYIEIVRRLEEDFLDGVQKNIRMRGAANILTNIRAIFRRGYSRTERIGYLLEKHIFSHVQDDEPKDALYISDLYTCPVSPDGEKLENFSPLKDNWQRAAKVPNLILNATTLNTGHNWQFTASWMGESPTSINRELDDNTLLRRVEYWQAPGRYKHFRLGEAVAASACVPGLFEPIVLDGLYKDMTVRLVEGGLHDNHGISALIEQNCTVLIVCDGDDHVRTQNHPGSGILEVPMRANGILTAHIREAQCAYLQDLLNSHAVRGLMYLHLQKGLDNETAQIIDGDESALDQVETGPGDRQSLLTSYGIRKDVQASLAAIRTDFDTFSDVEAYALMTSGYRMAEYEFPRAIKGFPLRKEPRPNWRFLSIEEAMKRVGSVEAISGTLNLLTVASNRGFKVWRLSRGAQFVGLFLGFVLLFVLYEVSQRWWEYRLTFPFRYLVFTIVGVCLALLAVKILLVVRKIPKTLTEIAIDVGVAGSSWLAANLYIWLLDRTYLKFGRVTPSALPSEIKVPPPILESYADEAFIQRTFTNVKDIVQQGLQQTGKPIKAVKRALDASDPTTNRFVDRSVLVEAICKLFEAAGDKVYRFPRSSEINPLQINLDLVAQHDERLICAEVKTASERGPSVDWSAALELQTASWFLKEVEKRDWFLEEVQKGKREGRETDSSPEAADVRALLVLVDIEADASLNAFRKEGVKVISYTTQEITEILNKSSAVIESVKGGEITSEQGRAEIQPLLGKLLDERPRAEDTAADGAIPAGT